MKPEAKPHRLRCLTLLLSCGLCLVALPARSQSEGTPPGDALEKVLKSLQAIDAHPEGLDSVLKWIEEEEAQTRTELEEVDRGLTRLKQQLEDLKSGKTTSAINPATPAVSPAGGSGKVDFTREVRPILASKCLKCHGPDEKTRKAQLRLDTFEGATLKAILPSNSADSEFMARVCAPNEADRMPPAETGLTLSAQEIELLKRWIDQGAIYQPHWAFVQPVQSPLPAVSQPAWPRNPIDRFVLERLDREGLAPEPEASKATLARRVSLDLIGLPPTVEELQAFLEDSSPDAYEKMVDRLLASPRFGERWAQVWLDLARYADTQGYEKDNSRTIWRYRDWVIDAFNQDMPFDRFTLEQMAGDLLPNPTTDQLIATAFHRNTMTNTEGGTDDEEFRNAAIVDRVNTSLEVWMGLTMGCAQCHTHKYDPITQTEYYQVFAFFNQTADTDQPDEQPTLFTPTAEEQARLEQIDSQIALANQLLDTSRAKLTDRQSDWEGPALETYARAAKLGNWYSAGPFEEEDFDLAKGAAFGTAFAPEQKVDLVATYREGKIAWTEHPEWVDGQVQTLSGESCINYLYRTLEAATNEQAVLELGSSEGIKVFLNDVLVHEKNEKRELAAGSDRETVDLKAGKNHLLLKVSHQQSGPNGFVFNLPGTTVPNLAWSALQKTGAERSEAEASALERFYLSVQPEYQRGEALLAELRNDRAQVAAACPTTPILRELPEDKRRKTHIQVRGSFLDLGEEVSPGVLAVFQPFPVNQPANRLGFARWLASEENPLTARVFVNRLWERLFGTGIVETAEDFGTQGELPTHPELLDWMSVEFMQKGWSVKQTLRLMVTSATYRQSSTTPAEKQAADPFNRLFARGPRFRLSAEMVRDQALTVSGLLSPKMFGPSVMPPQPEGIWQVVYSGDQWNTSTGEDRYRRGLYTFWRRTSPYPSMVAFDAPSREVCTLRRIRTNTPLQALVTLNDPVYVEAAQALAGTMIEAGGDSLGSRLDQGFLRTVCRLPDAAEKDRLQKLYASELEHYQAAPEEALQMATDPRGPLPEGVDVAEAAALTVVSNVLLNLDETLTKP